MADAVMAVLMSSPGLYALFIPVDLALDTGFSYGLRMGAPLMIGWTFLLFWADRKPLPRMDILMLTLPVIVGYVLIEAHGVATGLASLAETIPLFVMQAGMVSLFKLSYLNARSLCFDTADDLE